MLSVLLQGCEYFRARSLYVTRLRAVVHPSVDGLSRHARRGDLHYPRGAMSSRSQMEALHAVVAPLAGDRSARGTPAMKRLGHAKRDALLATATIANFRRGEIVYRPGGHARSLYLVLAGV